MAALKTLPTGKDKGGLPCPACGNARSRVLDTRRETHNDYVRRRRQCAKCATRYTTVEVRAEYFQDTRDWRAFMAELSAVVKEFEGKVA